MLRYNMMNKNILHICCLLKLVVTKNEPFPIGGKGYAQRPHSVILLDLLKGVNN